MKSTPRTPTFWSRLGTAAALTAVLAISQSNNLFTVTVGDQVLGAFGPGQRVNFQDSLGTEVHGFVVSGIEPGVKTDDPLASPIQLGFRGCLKRETHPC